MPTYSSILAWRIPGTEDPGGLPSVGSPRIRNDWRDIAAAAAAAAVATYSMPKSEVTSDIWTTRIFHEATHIHILRTRVGKCELLNGVQVFAITWNVAHLGPLSMESSRQECRSGYPFPSSGLLLDTGIEAMSCTLQDVILPSETYTSMTMRISLHWLTTLLKVQSPGANCPIEGLLNGWCN